MRIMVTPGDVYRWTIMPYRQDGSIFRFLHPYKEGCNPEMEWVIEYPSGVTQIVNFENGADREDWLIEPAERWEWDYVCLVN